jgi:uncharacterized BrkB/YihY/UPF0761 family membrane protein
MIASILIFLLISFIAVCVFLLCDLINYVINRDSNITSIISSLIDDDIKNNPH